MPILSEEAAALALPPMREVLQEFPADRIADPGREAAEAMAPFLRGIRPGMTVAVAVGSRGIRDIAEITKSVVDALKSAGARPFVVAAMGSHGSGTESGQRAILAGYGIVEEELGVRIDSAMSTVDIGPGPNGGPVLFSEAAFKADAVVPIARIKPHTDFRGPVESGLCKMLAIGLGKHSGCSLLHKAGFERFPELIPATARHILSRVQVPFGIAIIENSYDRTCLIEAVAGADFLKREPELLVAARGRMPRILVPEIDVLVIERIGKDISGAGMDPNIVGRTTKGILAGYDGPRIGRIVVLDVSDASHGNAIGIGLADFTVKGMLARIDTDATYANAIASGNPESARIPPALADESEAIRAALSCCPSADAAAPRIAKIRSTLDLRAIQISESLFQTYPWRFV